MRRETYYEIQQLVHNSQNALDRIMLALEAVPFDPEPEPEPAERWIAEAYFTDGGWSQSCNHDLLGEFPSKEAAEAAFQKYTKDLPYRARKIS